MEDWLDEEAATRMASEAVECAAEGVPSPFLDAALTVGCNGYKTPIKVKVLILGTSAHANALLLETAKEWKVLGAVALPSASFSGNTLKVSTREHQAYLYGQPHCASGGSQGTALLPLTMPHSPESANVLATGIMKLVDAENVLLLADIPQQNVLLPSEKRAADGARFVLASAAGLDDAKAIGIPFLPTGTLLTGLEAAVLVLKQAHQEKVIAVVQVMGPDSCKKTAVIQWASDVDAVLQAVGYPQMQQDLCLQRTGQKLSVCDSRSQVAHHLYT